MENSLVLRMKQLFSIVLLFSSVVACGGAGSKDNTSPPSPSPGAGGTSDVATSFTLQPSVPIFIDASEPAPVQRAVQDLQRDLKKIFGVESPVVNTASAIEGVPAVVVTYQGGATARYRTTALAGAESHSVATAGSAAVPRIVLQGADTRGTVYAIYTFSERILGIPPLWYWASIEPQQQSAITVPSNFALAIPSPSVPWRVAFPNDETFLSRWMSAKQQNFDAFFETLLRLKFNTINVDSIRDFPSPNQGLLRARAARDRGLAVTFTHLAPFGANPADWNNFWTLVKKVAVPPRVLSDQATLDTFWTYYINLVQRENLPEVIQSIVFRGAGDHGFWNDFSDAPKTDAARAQVVQNMLTHQISLLKSVSGNSQPLMRTVFYNEVATYTARSLLTPPAEPGLIWNYSSEQRDHYPYTDLMAYSATANPGRSLGYYMNMNFSNTGSHFAQGEGPWKVEKNIRIAYAQSGGRLDLVEFNIGNMREFALEVSTGADLLWNLSASTSDTSLQSFCARYFGAAHSSAATALYQDYYQGFWQQKQPDFSGGFARQYLFQDLRYARAAEDILGYLEANTTTSAPLSNRGPIFYRLVPADSGAATETQAIIAGTDAAIASMKTVVDKADALYPHLPASGQLLFNDNLRQQARFMMQANTMLGNLARALEAQPTGVAGMNPYLSAAVNAADALQASLDQRQQAPDFIGWYRTDSTFDIQAIKTRIKALIK